MNTVALTPLDMPGKRRAQATVAAHHYLRRPVDWRTSVEGYAVHVIGEYCILRDAGLLLFGRPEATRCADWYGGVDDVQLSRCEVTRWQVLNLSRAWLDPRVQAGGGYYSPTMLPGFRDRRGRFRSALASTALQTAIERIGYDYLLRRPPCFLDEPYEIRWLLSYCDTRLHRGTIYAAGGFERYRINDQGIETWRIRLPGLTPGQDADVRRRAQTHPRSRYYRGLRESARQIEMQITERP